MRNFLCCNEHICGLKRSKRCAVCELGFNYIAKNPVQTQSGELLCASCESTKIYSSLKFENHNVATSIEIAEFNEKLTKFVSNELFEKMHKKFHDAVELFQG